MVEFIVVVNVDSDVVVGVISSVIEEYSIDISPTVMGIRVYETDLANAIAMYVILRLISLGDSVVINSDPVASTYPSNTADWLTHKDILPLKEVQATG